MEIVKRVAYDADDGEFEARWTWYDGGLEVLASVNPDVVRWTFRRNGFLTDDKPTAQDEAIIDALRNDELPAKREWAQDDPGVSYTYTTHTW